MCLLLKILRLVLLLIPSCCRFDKHLSTLMWPAASVSDRGCQSFAPCLMLHPAPCAAADDLVVLDRYVDSAEWWVNGDNWECSVLFFVMYFQYITCALAYALGSTFRLSLFYNWAVVVSHPASPLPLLQLFVTHCAVLHLPSCSRTSSA